MALFMLNFLNYSYTVRMPTFLTPGRHGYSVRFSRTRPDALAVATSQYYGLAGGGTLFFLELAPEGTTIVELQKLEWSDGLFDVVKYFTSIYLYYLCIFFLFVSL